MPYTITETHYIDIDGVPLDTPAWSTRNRLEVFKAANKRGGVGVVIPGAHGRRAVPAWDDETTRTLVLDVRNDVDWDGTPHTSLVGGWLDNIRHLQEQIVADPGGDGTRLLTLHLGDDGELSGDVVVTGFDFNDATGVATLDVTIPAGQLVDTGS
jgi:hypothetical protein